ncbi:MAG: sigma-70 family RNA polymerase sigma factor [Parvularculaceae bacterium]|nr:sigma-70 family RNA polymerase sigma factor [Parvularculaceae bacterium]
MSKTSISSQHQLIEAIHADLVSVASALLRRGGRKVSLHTHDLVGEAVVRILGSKSVSVNDRAHLLALVARTMRCVLIDEVRSQQTQKRKGQIITLITGHGTEGQAERVDLLCLDHALRRLKVLDPQRALLVELRYFGGMSIDDTAEALGISASSVRRSWKTARVWLHQAMAEDKASRVDG